MEIQTLKSALQSEKLKIESKNDLIEEQKETILWVFYSMENLLNQFFILFNHNQRNLQKEMSEIKTQNKTLCENESIIK